MVFQDSPDRRTVSENFFYGLPFTVLLDYFHNVDGLNKLSPFLEQLEVAGKRILMVGKNGKRTDETIIDFTLALRDHFDHFLFRDLAELHGRQPNEVPELMRDALLSKGFPAEAIEILPDRDTAAEESLKRCRPGDLLVISPGTSDIELVWNAVNSLCVKIRAKLNGS